MDQQALRAGRKPTPNTTTTKNSSGKIKYKFLRFYCTLNNLNKYIYCVEDILIL